MLKQLNMEKKLGFSVKTIGNTSNMCSNLSTLHPSDIVIMKKEEKVDGKKHSKVSNSKCVPVESQLPANLKHAETRNSIS